MCSYNSLIVATVKVEVEELAVGFATQEVIELSSDDEDGRPIKREPVENETLLRRVKELEERNYNLKVHCEALQSRMRNSWNPLASSTLATDQSYEADKENSNETE